MWSSWPLAGDSRGPQRSSGGKELNAPRIGFLFPGQGAQYAGMGKDLFEEFPAARKIFESADTILGYPLSKICFEGPEDKLTRTLHAQPAIFTASMASLAVIREKFPDLNPVLAAGLSLGEFTALVAAGSFSFEDGLRLVNQRALAMEHAARKNPGTMASVMGLSEAACAAIARETGCEVANLNAPDQIALSGKVDAIEKACALAETQGAKRAIKLKVGGAFHSSLMRDAENELMAALQKIKIREPQCRFIPNVLGTPVSNPDEIRALLARQLVSAVRWTDTIRQSQSENILLALEIGPGKVLKGLARRIRPELKVECCGSVAEINALETSLNSVET